MIKRRAAFVADVSADIGAGHLARCATLARAMSARGWECTIATSNDAPASLLAGLQVAPIVEMEVDVVVIDNYAAPVVFERACRAWAKRVVVIDDAPNRTHACDLLLDQNAGRTAADYAAAAPGARVLAGSRYALIGEAFRARRETALARRRNAPTARRVLLSFGATDPANATSGALDELLSETWVERVTVLLSEAAPHRAAIRAAAEASGGRAELIIGAGAEQIADCVSEADVALGAAGSSAWERCCLGLSSAVTVVADNQRDIAAALGAAGAAIDLGALDNMRPGAFAQAARELATDAPRRAAMIEAAAALCDGDGANRVVEAIEQMCDAERT